MADHAARGKKALEASQFDEAIQAYTEAIKAFPTSPDYFIQRSTAYQRAQRINESLRDADQAVLNAQKRGKRDLIVTGQFRRGIALWHLERYGDAEFLFGLVKQMTPDHKLVPIWSKKTEMSLQNLDPEDPRRKRTVGETPEAPAADDSPSTVTSQPATTTTTTTSPPSTAASNPPVPQPQQTPANKIRHEWYQNTEHIYFTLLAKGVPADKAQIDIAERSLSISFPLSTGATYDLSLDPLFAPVQPDRCITRVMASKVEIILVKAVAGQKWPTIEAPAGTTGADASGAPSTAASAPPPPVTVKAPAYPTSSKSGPKDWDSISKNLNKKSSSSGGANGKEGAEEDDDDDDIGGDPANAFFKKLFKGATPEMQRAMMKSYTESNGTSLSTNWEEVSKGRVETIPPDGMEAKKW